MPSGSPCCQKNLKGCIATIVIVQCGLVLLYVEFTYNKDHAPKPTKTQRKHLEYTKWNGTTWLNLGGSNTPSPAETSPNIYDNVNKHVTQLNNSIVLDKSNKDSRVTKLHSRLKNKSFRERPNLRASNNGSRAISNFTRILGESLLLAKGARHGILTNSAQTNHISKADRRRQQATKNPFLAFQSNNSVANKANKEYLSHSRKTFIQRVRANRVLANRSNRTSYPRHGKTVTISPVPQSTKPIVNEPKTNVSANTASRDTGIKLSHSYNFSRPYVFRMPPRLSTDEYFVTKGAYKCLKEGVTEGSVNNASIGCQCKFGWHGRHCSIKDSVYFGSGFRFLDSAKISNTSRHLINAFPFNVEWEALETRFYELHDVVDLFIILESNHTNFGEHKPLLLLERLQKGYLSEFHSKILYICRGYFPIGGREDGWLVDHHMRSFLGREGMKRVNGTKPDDIIVYTDADELPTRDALLFLKLHTNYPEPFGLTLRWSVFGFFWKQPDPTRVTVGCTIAMLRFVFQFDLHLLRSGEYYTKQQSQLQAYMKSGAHVLEWYMGEVGYYTGWHCSWCLTPDRIRTKLKSAINADFPRWGDYPDKLNLTYIRNLVKTGTWFDDVTRYTLADMTAEQFYAPRHLLENSEKYKYLLDVKYV